MHQRHIGGLLILVLGAACAGRSVAHDWPQWRGPGRDAISPDKGLLTRWPDKGPPLAWTAHGIGHGYSSVAIAGGKIFTIGDRDDGGRQQEFVIALNQADGKELWAARVGDPWSDGGPRCTPTVAGDLVYALGPHGDLVCLEADGGKERWRKNLASDFGGHMMSGWGYSESPLVDGDRLICTPGGGSATLVALDRKTGATFWKAQVPNGNGAAYSSVIAGDVGKQRIYVQFLQGGVVGVDADNGKLLWRYNKPANGTANCATPIFHEGYVFAASAYGTGGGLVRLNGEGTNMQAHEEYFTTHMQNHHGGMVLVDGYLYGADNGTLTCLEFKTGKVMWDSHQAGKGSIAYADGRLYYRNEGGPMFLIKADPHKYVSAGRFDQPSRGNGPAWAHPALADGRLYLRDDDVLLCFNVQDTDQGR
jgi:outer membrane protein assembly factor BamB